MPRLRVADDEQLLSAAQQVLYELGPADFTLERAAARGGVSPATLIKRFGSKKRLFLELNRRWVASVGPALAAAAAGQATPLGRLRAAALVGFSDLDSPARTANQLATFALDLQDAAMRELLAAGWQIVQDRLTELAGEAIAAGELPRAGSPEQVARILRAAGEGIRITWCVQPAGSLVAQAEADIDAILAAWTAPSAGPSGGQR
jgi:AcrR family transcriptional regulator